MDDQGESVGKQGRLLTDNDESIARKRATLGAVERHDTLSGTERIRKTR